MKLLYIWINQSENSAIKEQGFALSNKYIYEHKDNIFKVNPNINYVEDFFNINNLKVDITAIVGENGAGKTTLLTEILSKTFAPSINHFNQDEKYEKAFQDQLKINLAFLIFESDDGNLGVVSNISNIQFRGCRGEEIRRQDSIEELSTCIAATNANKFGNKQGTFSIGSKYSEIILSDESIKVLAGIFAKKELDYDNLSFYKERKFIEFQKIATDKISELYQDFIVLDFLLNNNETEFMGKHFDKVLVKSRSIFNYKLYRKDEENSSLSEYKWRHQFATIVLKLYNELKIKNEIIKQLVAQFFAEIYWVMFPNEANIYNFNLDVVSNLEKLKEKTSNYDEGINDSDEGTHRRKIKAYYLDSIELLSDIMKVSLKKTVKNNKMPGFDQAYEEWYECKVDKSDELLKVVHPFNQKNMCIAKYLKLDFEGLSSGEDALLNLYSRIFWSLKKLKVNNTIILLIDEADLYLHPEWQRKFLMAFINDIAKFMPKNVHNIQIIFSTHSPIMLSDIPKQDIIYMINDMTNKTCRQDDHTAHSETFATNIHKLFSDSFFLKDKMLIGEYAKSKLDIALDIINNGNPGNLSKNDKQLVEEIINFIGDGVLKTIIENQYERRKGYDIN